MKKLTGTEKHALVSGEFINKPGGFSYAMRSPLSALLAELDDDERKSAYGRIIGLSLFKDSGYGKDSSVLVSKPKYDKDTVKNLPGYREKSIVYFAYLYNDKKLINAYYFKRGDNSGKFYDYKGNEYQI